MQGRISGNSHKFLQSHETLMNSTSDEEDELLNVTTGRHQASTETRNSFYEKDPISPLLSSPPLNVTSFTKNISVPRFVDASFQPHHSNQATPRVLFNNPLRAPYQNPFYILSQGQTSTPHDIQSTPPSSDDYIQPSVSMPDATPPATVFETHDGEDFNISRTSKKSKVGWPKKQNASISWTDEQTDLLIDLWKAHPILYNVSDPHYHKREKRSEAIVDIERELRENAFEFTTDEINEKMTSLKSYFSVERGKLIKSRGGSSRGCGGGWGVGEEMKYHAQSNLLGKTGQFK